MQYAAGGQQHSWFPASRRYPQRKSGRNFIYPTQQEAQMTLTAEKELQHIGETCGCADHANDLVHDLSKRLDALWRYDQYIANAEGKAQLQNLWRELKRQEIDNIKRVKLMVAEEIRQNCF